MKDTSGERVDVVELSPAVYEEAPVTNLYPEQPRCRNCGQPFSSPVPYCPTCRAPQFAPQTPPPVYVVPQQKSVVVAVILALLWLGLGQLYVGKLGLGLALAISDIFLVLLSFSGVGLFISVPVWCVLVPLTTIMAGVAAQNHNRTAAMPAVMR
jgi:TM2 domain-containing membrane protein YozV